MGRAPEASAEQSRRVSCHSGKWTPGCAARKLGFLGAVRDGAAAAPALVDAWAAYDAVANGLALTTSRLGAASVVERVARRRLEAELAGAIRSTLPRA